MLNAIEKIFAKLQRIHVKSTINKLIKPKDLVLEVGCGNSPVSQSSVLLDKYVFATEIHRSNKKSINQFHGKPFIFADGAKLPFKDKSMDVIICRHVIEHVNDPAGFIQELQRVGKKGYLEWPSIFCELIRGGYGAQDQIRAMFPPDKRKLLEELEHGKGTTGHRWFIVPVGNCLYFLAKNKEYYPLYLLYGAYAKSKDNEKIIHKLLSKPISYRTWSVSNPIYAAYVADSDVNDVAGSLHEDYDLFEQINYLNKCNPGVELETDLYRTLCCPACQLGDLEKNANRALDCSRCNAKYPIINGFPVLLAQASNYSY